MHELDEVRQLHAEAEKATQQATYKLEKTMTVVDEMKNLKFDVL